MNWIQDLLMLDKSILKRLVEPTDPAERALAIRICRANNGLDPETGAKVADLDRARKTWEELLHTKLPDEKILWMWNHGRFEWHPDFMPETADQPTDGVL
jgi:hypothetical protein